jgi:hypothetical protein
MSVGLSTGATGRVVERLQRIVVTEGATIAHAERDAHEFLDRADDVRLGVASGASRAAATRRDEPEVSRVGA